MSQANETSSLIQSAARLLTASLECGTPNDALVLVRAAVAKLEAAHARRVSVAVAAGYAGGFSCDFSFVYPDDSTGGQGRPLSGSVGLAMSTVRPGETIELLDVRTTRVALTVTGEE